jgi:multicomponent Na+:H+ antiporter subunit E
MSMWQSLWWRRLWQRLVVSVPLALVWMPITAKISLESFSVGLALSFAVLSLIYQAQAPVSINWSSIPDRTLASLQYLLMLLRDVYLAAVDVAKRVLHPSLPLNPGIIAFSTQYAAHAHDQNLSPDAVTAISAHGITITPGELVVDFEGTQTMFVHCLDITASAQVAEQNQAKRMALLRRILA